MGDMFVILWFGKSVDELKQIRETRKDLTPSQLKELDDLFAKKEKESK